MIGNIYEVVMVVVVIIIVKGFVEGRVLVDVLGRVDVNRVWVVYNNVDISSVFFEEIVLVV